MNKYSGYFLIITILLLSCNPSRINITLAPVFSDQMILQQAQSNAVWGTAKPNTPITLTASWGESIITNSDESGHWMLLLPTPSFEETKNSIKQSFQVSDGHYTIEIKDVLIGEVWLASGQSNMEWYMNQCENCVINQVSEIASSANDMIRMFSVPRDLSGKSIKQKKWLTAHPEHTGSFSATAYYFAKNLYEKLAVPIGIVNTSWGGSRIESWISSKKLKELDETKDLLPDDYNFLVYKEFYRHQNDSLVADLDIKHDFTTYNTPPWSDDIVLWSKFSQNWEELDLNDQAFKNLTFDDSSWDYWVPEKDNYGGLKSNGRFEAVLDESDPLLSDGVIWFRTYVDIPDSTSNYVLQIDSGIDDIDQTYFNGKLVGNSYGWNLERKYIIPNNLIHKGRNVIAFRVTDLGYGGGFNSPVILFNDQDTIRLPFEDFKFKHHAFILNGLYIIVHDYTSTQLDSLPLETRKDITNSTPINQENGYSAMYECMLTPVIPYGIKGIIWYQGESNVHNFQDYTNLLTGMIEDWRSAWNAQLPFYFAQIAPFTYDKSLNAESLRDAQRKLLHKVEHTGMAVLTDIGEEFDIHPRNKKDVGERLSLHALKNEYGFDLIANGPLYKDHVGYSKYIEVSFDHTAEGLRSVGDLIGFEVAGSDEVFYPAKATIIKDKIRVFSKEVSEPLHVRYGWKNWFVGNLFNSEGLPASSFSSL